jgi:hypothetical protein
MADWTPVKRQFERGDTIRDSFYNRIYFMPEVTYEEVGARNEHGSVEGEYISDKCGFSQYQSVMRNCRMVLVEKNNAFIQNNVLLYMEPREKMAGSPRKYMWPNKSKIRKILSKYPENIMDLVIQNENNYV